MLSSLSGMYLLKKLVAGFLDDVDEKEVGQRHQIEDFRHEDVVGWWLTSI